MNNHAIETMANKWETNKQVWTTNPTTETLLLGDFNQHHSTTAHGMPDTTTTSPVLAAS